MSMAAVFVSPAHLHRLSHSAVDLRETVAGSLKEGRPDQTPGLVDAREAISAALARLRDDPYKMLSIASTPEPSDKEVKAMYWVLARRFHPDKSGFESGELFACAHFAYERLADAASRLRFNQERREEEREKASARSNGEGALHEVEVKYARERARQQAESFTNWRSTQRETVVKWGDDDRRATLYSEAKAKGERRRVELDAERRRHSHALEAARQSKAEALRRSVSVKLQARLKGEEDAARARVEALEALRPDRENKDRSGGSKVESKCSTSIIPRAVPGVVPNGSVQTSRSYSSEERQDMETVRVVFPAPGQMGFTLCEAASFRSDSVAWAAAILRMEHSSDGTTSKAEAMGLRKGDLLGEVNGCSVHGLSFKEACDVLQQSHFPRCAVFLRP